MDIAFCTEDKHRYNAREFFELPTRELSRKRDFLECIECKNKAFYRKPARNGRGPCFGARHEDGCMQATSESEDPIAGSGDDKDELINVGDRIVLDLNFGGTNPEVHIDGDPGAPRRPRGGRHVGGDGPRRAVSHKRLGPLLSMLIESPNFRYSTQIIEIEKQPDMTVADRFIEMTEATPQLETQFRGYWGKIQSVVDDGNGDVWLNSGRKNHMSLKLSIEDQPSLLKRSRLKDWTALKDRYILVLGEIKIGRSGKMIFFIKDLNLVAIR